MLNADEQEHIIRANKKAFEQLALSWRNPETGETEPGPGRAKDDYASTSPFPAMPAPAGTFMT